MPDASQWLPKLGALNVSRSKAKGPAPNGCFGHHYDLWDLAFSNWSMAKVGQQRKRVIDTALECWKL